MSRPCWPQLLPRAKSILDGTFQAWADTWISGANREPAPAETIVSSIRKAWSFPEFSDEWYRFFGNEKASKPTRALEAELSKMPDPSDARAQASICAALSALDAAQSAYQYGLLPFFRSVKGQFPEVVIDFASRRMTESINCAKSFAAQSRRLRAEVAGSR